MNKLTKYERLNLINQYEILKKLSRDAEEIKHYENNITILENGYTKRYHDLFDHYHEEMSEEDISFVNDVLDLYEDAMFAYNRLSPENQNEELENKCKFSGFDLNDSEQASYYGYADFMINENDGWFYLKEMIDEKIIDLNSHGFGPSMIILQNYINTYKKIKNIHANNNTVGEALSAQELNMIFSY